MESVAQRVMRSSALYASLAAILMAGAVLLIAGGLMALPMAFMFAVLLGIAGAVLILLNPYWGIILFLCLLYVRIEFFFYGGLPVIGKNGFQIFTAIVVALTMFSWPFQLLLKKEKFKWGTELGWMAAFAFLTFLSTYSVPDMDYAIEALIDVLKLAGVFFLLQQLLHTEKRAISAVQWLLLFVVILSLCAIYGYVTGTEPVPFKENGAIRASVAGVFNPNALAGTLAMVCPIALITIMRGKTWWWRLWGVVALGILLVGLYLTNSRGGILAVGLGMGIVLVQQLGWIRGFLLAVLAGTLLIVCGPSRLAQSAAVVSEGGVQADESSMGRVIAWRHGLEMFEKRPLMGVGFNQFPAHSPVEAHNSFVQALGEGGFLNALCWVGFNYWGLLVLVRLRQSRRREHGVDRKDDPIMNHGVAVLAGLSVILFLGISGHRAYDYDAWALVGIASAFGAFNREKSESGLSDWPHYAAVLGLTLSLLAWVYLVVHVLKD
jgi:O-antigen ligase